MYSVCTLIVISERAPNAFGACPECFETVYNYIRSALPMYSVCALNVISERALNVILGRVANVSMNITHTLCGIRSKGQ